MGKIDTILFDFDGTIMDTNNTIIKTWQHTYKQLTGREGSVDDIISTFGEMLYDSMAKAFPDVPPEKSVKIYRSYQEKFFEDTIELFPGILKTLIKIKEKGCKTALATSRLRKTTDIGIDKFGIRKYFDVIVTAEDVHNHKPHPETVRVCLERLRSKPESTIMIGDSLYDLQCAHAAGIGAVLCGWSMVLRGKTMADFAPGDAPDYIINKAEDLLDII